MISSQLSVFAMAAAVLFAPPAGGCNDTFADSVVSYDPGPGQFVHNPMFNNPARALGPPHGLYVDEPDNSSQVTLGDGGSITLAFHDPVTDNPANPYGLDFIVFSNATFVGGDPYYRWQELAYVEISQNGTNWYLILPSVLPSALQGGVDTGQSHTVVSGYAEYTPTVGLPQELAQPPFAVSRTSEELYTVPDRPSVPDDPGTIDFDYVSGGGDAFDIAHAVVESARGVPALDGNGRPIPANLGWFKYVRLTDALVGDTWGVGEISAEIDAASRVRPAMAIGQAKKLPQGGYALITDAVVTAAFWGEFFVESPDRTAAVKIISDEPVAVGDRVTVTGHISRPGGAFSLGDPMFTVTSSGNIVPKPLGMGIKWLGSDLTYGLRVRVWGGVTDPGDGSYCIITDGRRDAKVVCEESFAVAQGSWVSVTGVCDKEVGGALIRVLQASDISIP